MIVGNLSFVAKFIILGAWCSICMHNISSICFALITGYYFLNDYGLHSKIGNYQF